jgi:hypothetical protein
MNHHLCPTCWRPATRTPHHKIYAHFDKAYNPCESSGEPFYTTLIATFEPTEEVPA